MNLPASKPKQFGPEYGAQFGDESIVAAYRYRPPYPTATFDILSGLMADGPRLVLDAGCGSGDLTIPLAKFVERVDAVDLSAAMIDVAKARPGGNDRHIRWIISSMEEAPLDSPYALITAGESLHWMDWPVVLRRFREVLTPNGLLAIVGRIEQANPWWAELLRTINVYSTNRDYQPYNLIDELEGRDLFTRVGVERTEPEVFEQSVDDYVESIHSRNGFSRDRMTPDAAQAFDREARTLLGRHADDGVLRFEVVGSVVWGQPCSRMPV